MGTHIERWGSANEVERTSSLLEFHAECAKCGQEFKPGEWVRARYGPRGGTHFHDDCTDAHDGDEEEVEDDSPPLFR